MYAVEYTWISVPTPVTTRIIIAESGSRRSSQAASKAPIAPLPTSSGIDPIQSTPGTSTTRSPLGSPRSCQNAATDSASATVIVEQATIPATLREQ
jgi:hypothetical protein